MRREELIGEADELIERLRRGIQAGNFSNADPDAHVTVEEYGAFCESIHQEILDRFGAGSRQEQSWHELNTRLQQAFAKYYKAADDSQETQFLRAYIDDLRAYRSFIRKTFSPEPGQNHGAPAPAASTLYARLKTRLEDNPVFVVTAMLVGLVGAILVFYEAYKAATGQ